MPLNMGLRKVIPRTRYRTFVLNPGTGTGRESKHDKSNLCDFTAVLCHNVTLVQPYRYLVKYLPLFTLWNDTSEIGLIVGLIGILE